MDKKLITTTKYLNKSVQEQRDWYLTPKQS